MLTGRPPFQGEYDQALIYSIVNEEPPQIAIVRDDVPPALQGIVERALRKKPEERYERMADMLEAIRVCAHECDLPRSYRRIAVAPRGKRLAIVVSCAAAALIAAFALFRGYLLPSRERAITSLAVLPFTNLSSDTGQEYFSDGMTEAIIAELSKIKALRVISRTSVMRYRKSDKSLSRIAQELGVEAIVEGSVQRAGDEVRITAQLVQAHPEKHIWANDFNRSLANLLALQSEVAEEIARQIHVAVTPEERKRIEIARAANPAAHDAYLKGRFLVEKNSYADIRRGMSFLEETIAIDSTYAPAYTGLAKGYDILGGLGYYPPKEAWPKVRALAEKALSFDPNLCDAYLLLADADFVYDWDFKGAGLSFQRAIALNPNDATTRSWYATYLASMGRLNEAIIEAERSVALDPLSPIILINYAWILFVDGRYDSALVAARNVIVLEPAASLAHHVMAHAYTRQGKYEEAIRECQISLALGDSTVLYEIALSRAVAGRVAEAREALAELERIAKRTYVSPVEFARIYYTLGDKERAFSLLDEAYRKRATDLIHIKTEPYFEGLRSDPRFAALLKRIGFPS
jgi:TolB-like protein/Flp pilus assembly protein TadD